MLDPVNLSTSIFKSFYHLIHHDSIRTDYSKKNPNSSAHSTMLQSIPTTMFIFSILLPHQSQLIDRCIGLKIWVVMKGDKELVKKIDSIRDKVFPIKSELLKPREQMES
ncbi:hypothetical protein L2E82_14856 [Cichorium intybus]|uniref:Uncharacterized protein n=1 Tax=Cichorium intybus TaxID=13427 RepID=A0ACB9F165_CICIN|nr:hypothetical protein L2E82_14856 [Cichorium intybus]